MKLFEFVVIVPLLAIVALVMWAWDATPTLGTK